ncbi:hypothetical protein AB0284_17405 [Pseudarthrobacter phenanthrenivorans]|uniref:hypothetical protein n=1 Tax=Pseudarthrobacter phenanthrenivorans TaxID=361575 RepID=UPI00344D0723
MRIRTRILAPTAALLAVLLPAAGASAAPANIDHFDTLAVDLTTCASPWNQINGDGTNQYVSKVQKDGTYIEHYRLHAQGTDTRGTKYVMNWTMTYRTSTRKTSIDQQIMAVSKGPAPNQVLTYHYDSTTGKATLTEDCRG